MSYGIGGLAVALGIGSAVLAGAGVAAADPGAGSGGAESATATSSSTRGDATDRIGHRGYRKEAPARHGTRVTAGPGTADADTEEADTDGAPRRRPGPRSAVDRDGDRPVRTARDHAPGVGARPGDVHRWTSPADDGAQPPRPPAEPAPERTEPQPQTPVPAGPAVVVAPVAGPDEPPGPAVVPAPAPATTVAVGDEFSRRGRQVPSPIVTAAAWTVAAAARREFADGGEHDRPAAQQTTTGRTDPTPTAAAVPGVTVIPQVAPLEFLQRIPGLGPTLITPIVEFIHRIPILGDMLHPLVGFPLRPGEPAPRDVKIISPDGTAIYVHFMPAAGLAPGEQAPTVLNGPGLGMPGATNLDGTFLDGWLADIFGMIDVGTLRRAGYNVVTWDPRGEYNSGGRAELNAAEFEARDMAAIIDWIATQPEALLDAAGDPRLGMTGVSYGGGIQLATAATDHRVDAIVPAIAYHSLISSLYKEGAFKNSWAALLSNVLLITLARFNPRVLPAAIYGAVTGQMLPSDRDLLESRNPRVEHITVPTLLIQGTVDTLFSPAEADATARILMANGVPVKVVWFCGGHGVCTNNPHDMSDGELIVQRTLQWLDRYVKGDPGVATGPAFEWVDQRGQWWASDEYPVRAATPIVAAGGPARLPLVPYVGGSGIPFLPYAAQAPVAVNVRLPEATETTFIVGAPVLTLTYSGVGTSRHVYAQLVDDSTGLVLGSLITPIPVTLDGQTHQVTVTLEPVAHTLPAGQSVTLQLVAASGTYERILPGMGVLDVHAIEVTVPTADPAAVSPGGVTTVQPTTAA